MQNLDSTAQGVATLYFTHEPQRRRACRQWRSCTRRETPCPQSSTRGSPAHRRRTGNDYIVWYGIV
jgi:hypothetical protein